MGPADGGLIVSRLLQELGLEKLAVSLEQSLAGLDRLADRMESVRGVSRSMAMEAESLLPGFVNHKRPIGYYSMEPSRCQYRVALEELSRGMWAAIAVGIAAAFSTVIGLILALVSDDDAKDKSSGGKSSVSKALNNSDKAAEQSGKTGEAADVLTHARETTVNDAIRKAHMARMGVVGMEDIQSHSHTSITHFAMLDKDLLMQNGLYALLHSDKDLARNAQSKLRPAISESDRIVDEFDKRVPDYRAVAEAIKRLQENSIVNDNYEDGMGFHEYVQMLMSHREKNMDQLKISRLSDFTELVRGMRQYSEKNFKFFNELLRRNASILEDMAHEAKALAERSRKVQTGVSQGTEDDTRTLVKEAQRFIMETCKSLRALGSYVHLTIWCSNRHAKFVMFLTSNLKGILVDAKAILKKEGVEVPEYFEDAIKSLDKVK